MRRGVLRVALLVLLAAAPAHARDTGVIESRRAGSDFALTADPAAAPWKGVHGVIADHDRFGAVVPGHRTEIRSRWTPQNLYLLFICPYEDLYLHPDPSPSAETNKLWDWDVAEAFIGSDFKEIKKYKEFQVSPQAEWVDLAIDRGTQPPSHDVAWNSGYEVKARLDRDHHVWYCRPPQVHQLANGQERDLPHARGFRPAPSAQLRRPRTGVPRSRGEPDHGGRRRQARRSQRRLRPLAEGQQVRPSHRAAGAEVHVLGGHFLGQLVPERVRCRVAVPPPCQDCS